MSYRWITPERLELRPHRSLPRKGFAVVVLLFFALVTIPLAAMIGTALLWALLPFAMTALGALWWGLQRSYRDGEVIEVLSLEENEVSLTRTEPGGALRTWNCNRYWVRLHKHERNGPVPHYITLSGNGREVEVGAFLSEEERQALHTDLARRLMSTG